MGPRHIWKAWRKLRARRNIVGGTVGMSFLVAATSAALGQTPVPSTDQSTGQASGEPSEDVALPGVQVAAQRARSYLPTNPGLFRLTDQYLDIPQSMAIVTKDLMREQAAFTLRDSLRNVTGISLQAGEGGGGQGDNLSLRGYPARTDIFLDGIRDVGQYNRDVFNLEAVEVLGPLGRLLRPRIDGRRHQPDQQIPATGALLRLHAQRGQRPARTRHRRLQPAPRP